MPFCEPSDAAALLHAPVTPAAARGGSSTIAALAASGETIGRIRYVRAQPSTVLVSRNTTPIGIPRGKTLPSPELTISVPGFSSLRNGTPRISSRKRSAPDPRCAATIPNATPSGVVALARKSGCVQRIAVLELASTDVTIPISPSGTTNGENGRTPAALPAASNTVCSSPPRGACTTSVATNPHCRRCPSPSSPRSRSFSARNGPDACDPSARLSTFVTRRP